MHSLHTVPKVLMILVAAQHAAGTQSGASPSCSIEEEN